MDLLLRGFDSKEVAENVAAEILKRGVAKSANVHEEQRGDLQAAQEGIAGMWVLLNVISETPSLPAELRELVKKTQADVTPVYLKAMGDEVPEPKPTAR